MDEKELLSRLPKSLNRREMLKLSAALGTAALLNPLRADGPKAPNTEPDQSKASIVIAGGGDAGITIAARLRKLLPKATITIIEPRALHYYQPGQTLIGGGVWTIDDIQYETRSVIPQGVKLLAQKVARFEPQENRLQLDNQQIITYDFLVVSTGLQDNFQAVEGISDLTQINSVYTPATANNTFTAIKELAEQAKERKVKALFTQPATPIKCGGAPKKIMYMAEHYLRHKGVRENVDITFMTPGSAYFGVDPYEKAVKQQFGERGLNIAFGHELTALDSTAKQASFIHRYEEQGAYDKDLEEYDMIAKEETRNIGFDFIHVVPAMRAHQVVKESPLAWQKGTSGKYGLLEVDEKSLQHKRFPNVFGAGDVIGTRFGKTGGSVRKQAPVVAQNIADLASGKEPSAAYDGYTVCPLITGYGSVMLAEFNYDGAAPSFPLDPAQERWIWWLLKLYGLKPLYFQGMLKGIM